MTQTPSRAGPVGFEPRAFGVMNKPNALPARPLSTWTPEEKEMHAVILRHIGRGMKPAAREMLRALNASLAVRGARSGYTL